MHYLNVNWAILRLSIFWFSHNSDFMYQYYLVLEEYSLFLVSEN